MRAQFLRLAAVVSLALAAGTRAHAEEREPVVEKLRFEGVSAVSEQELRDVALTAGPSWKFWRPDPPFDEETLRDDLDRVVGFYREHGYYDAEASYALVWNDEHSAVRVEISVQEGEPVRLVEISIEVGEASWLDAPARERLLADLPLVEGEVFGAAVYRAGREALLARLANLGHPGAVLTGGAEVDPLQHTASVHWVVQPGPEVHFGPIRVEGVKDVNEQLVRRELTFEEGQVFSLDALEASQRRIYDLDLFRAVTLQPERPAAGAAAALRSDWPILARVEERPLRTIRVSVGYGTEDDFRAQVNWKRRNFFGGARTFEATGKYSSLIAGIEARFVQPRLFDPKLRLEADVSLLRETVPAYDAYRASAGVLLRRPLDTHWTARAGYRYEFDDVTDLKVDDLDADKDSRLSSLIFGLERSTLDNRLSPSSGTRLDLSITPTLAALGSRSSFLRLDANGSAFHPLFGAVLGLRLHGETIQPFAQSGRDDVPVTSRLYGGGSGSVRGFEFQRLPPLDDGGEPLGGLTLAEASVELRFPIWRVVHGVAFFDAGQLAQTPFGFRLDDLYYSTGPGIRIQLPFGALGLDYGYLLRRPSGVDRGRVSFSVGNTF